MVALDGRSTRARPLGVALIVIVGLLNFHVPHFLLERAASPGDTSTGLELVFVANLLCALVAAAAIWRHRGWGWWLGLVIVGVSFALYVAQETVGLPGLPQSWWEPSRIVSVAVEVLFILVAWTRVIAPQTKARTSARA